MNFMSKQTHPQCVNKFCGIDPSDFKQETLSGLAWVAPFVYSVFNLTKDWGSAKHVAQVRGMEVTAERAVLTMAYVIDQLPLGISEALLRVTITPDFRLTVNLLSVPVGLMPDTIVDDILEQLTFELGNSREEWDALLQTAYVSAAPALSVLAIALGLIPLQGGSSSGLFLEKTASTVRVSREGATIEVCCDLSGNIFLSLNSARVSGVPPQPEVDHYKSVVEANAALVLKSLNLRVTGVHAM